MADGQTVFRIVTLAKFYGKAEPMEPEWHYSKKMRGRPDYSTEEEATAELRKIRSRKNLTKPKDYYYIVEISRVGKKTEITKL